MTDLLKLSEHRLNSPPAAVHAPSRKAARRGFSTITLVLALAAFAMVSLLAGIQAGDINFGAFIPAGKPGKAASKGLESPLLLAAEATPDNEAVPADGTEPAGPAEVEELPDPEGAERIEGRTRQLICKAFGIMDPLLAAERLQVLNDNDATLVLSCQERRELAWILEMADPQEAANWVNILLQVDDFSASLPPGESILDQINEDPSLALPGASGDAPLAETEPAAASLPETASLPDFMLDHGGREEFLMQFPGFSEDDLATDRNTAIPAISVSGITD